MGLQAAGLMQAMITAAADAHASLGLAVIAASHFDECFGICRFITRRFSHFR